MRINYCMQCSQPLQQHDETCYECPQGHEYFDNPRAGVSVVFLQNGTFLAAQRAIEPKMGTYSFVGGFLQYGEDARTGAKREVREETGVDLLELELLDVSAQQYDADTSTCSIIFLAKRWEGKFKAADDAGSLVWKPLDFMVSSEFVWPHPELLAQLKTMADNT